MDLLGQMATFVRVVEGKSLSAAARAQRLSLPAVSRQLRALETELGASLVVRSTRRLHLTDAGRRWYEHCVRILRDVDAARSAVRSAATAHGTLVVSASLSFGAVVIVPRLAGLAERHPHLAVHVRLEDHLVDLVAEGVDVAVRAGSAPPDSTAYVAHPIASSRRVVVAAPRLLRRHGAPRTPAQLARAPCLVQVTQAGAAVRWRLARGDGDGDGDARSEEAIDVDGRLRSNAPVALRDLALAGAGFAYLPEWLVADDLAHDRLRRVLPAWASQPISSWAVYRAELRGAPRIRAFLEVLPAELPRVPDERAAVPRAGAARRGAGDSPGAGQRRVAPGSAA